MDLLSLQPGSQIFSRNLPPRAAVQGVALVSWVFWDRGYFLRLLLFLLRFPSQPATREGLSALSPPLRTPCLLPFPSLFCITSPLLSRGQAILASRTPGQTGLCRAAHSSGRSAGDSSAKWPELMTSRPAGLARRESWASACREKKKKRSSAPWSSGRFTLGGPAAPRLRQTDNYLENDILWKQRTHQETPEFLVAASSNYSQAFWAH